MMAKPLASSGNMEFPKNSIKSDKFTVFFDKLLKIFEGKCGALRGNAGVKISRPQKHRENNTARRARAQRQMRGIAPRNLCGLYLIRILGTML